MSIREVLRDMLIKSEEYTDDYNISKALTEIEKFMFKDDKEFAEAVGAILADFAVSVDGRIAHKTYFNEQLGIAESRLLDLRAKERENEKEVI